MSVNDRHSHVAQRYLSLQQCRLSIKSVHFRWYQSGTISDQSVWAVGPTVSDQTVVMYHFRCIPPTRDPFPLHLLLKPLLDSICAGEFTCSLATGRLFERLDLPIITSPHKICLPIWEKYPGEDTWSKRRSDPSPYPPALEVPFAAWPRQQMFGNQP